MRKEIYDQVMGAAGIAVDILTPSVGTGVHLFIHSKVGDKLEAAIAAIGGRAAMVDWFGLIVGGMVSGAIHDLEGDRGVVVNSKAHPAPWTAYGDGLLDDPRNAASKAEAIAGIAEAKADIDQAYLIGVGERIAKASVPSPPRPRFPPQSTLDSIARPKPHRPRRHEKGPRLYDIQPRRGSQHCRIH